MSNRFLFWNSIYLGLEGSVPPEDKGTPIISFFFLKNIFFWFGFEGPTLTKQTTAFYIAHSSLSQTAKAWMGTYFC